MNIEEFNYHLPPNLIAQFPKKDRSDSRLLILNPSQNKIVDKEFKSFIDTIKQNDLVIFNNTKVIKARLFGEKNSGGKVEILIEKIINEHLVIGHIGTSKKIKDGLEILVGPAKIRVQSRIDNMFLLSISIDVYQLIDQFGQLPLPPYINRKNNEEDLDRYQTIFAKHEGAIASPTAGLHFDDVFFDQLKQKEIDYDFITLHVGSGTFQPVRQENIQNHKMHSEEFFIDENVYKKIEQTKKNNGRVIAIGTTVLRALESAYSVKKKITGFQKTDIFIYPGYRFKVVDSLFTNFHLPKSTLLMLVSAFAGHSFIMAAYRHAVHEEYRFFSYGDAMFIEQRAHTNDKEMVDK
jgi:S-adenosylmethionine:tRNA ribosyltransferase-isomerase